MVRISLLAHKFRGEEKKKASTGNLGFSVCVHSCFSSWKETLLTLGGGEQRSQNALQWHQPCYFLSGHNPRLGGTFLAWGAHFSLGEHTSRLGAQAVIWGCTAPKCIIILH